VAGLFGLWRGAKPPAAEWRAAPGHNARLFATYYRQLFAGAVDRSLRAAVLSTDRGFPRPRRHGATAVYVPDSRLAAQTMAEAWWTKHGPALRSHREQVVAPEPQPVTVRQALGEFFGFMLAAIKGAPAAWRARIEGRVSSAIARRVTQAVYGAGSAYTVVVKGIAGDGRPARLRDVAESAAVVEAALDRAGSERVQEPLADNVALWSEFVHGGLTLADGGARVAELPPVSVGADLGVVRDPAWVAPPPEAAFDKLSGQLVAVLDIERVHSYDPIGVAELERRLDRSAQTPGLAFDVSGAREHLKQWKATTPSSYAGAVAQSIMRAWDYTLREFQQYLAILDEAAGSAEVDLADGDRRRMRIPMILLGTVLAVAAAVVCTVIGILAVPLGAVIAAVVFVGGVIGAFATFYRENKLFFQRINRRRALEDAAAVAERNLRSVVRDLRRISDAYAQLQVWVPVLARFLAEPFGRPVIEADEDIRLGGPFPRGLQVGVVERDETAEAAVAAEIRRDLFRVGWLSEPWQSLINAAPQRLRPEDADSITDINALYRMPAVADGEPSVLSRWAQDVATNGTQGDGAGALWDQVVRDLHDKRQHLLRDLTARMRMLGHDELAPASLNRLGEGIAPGTTFDPSLLGDRAATNDAARVVTQFVSDGTRGLSEHLLVVQYTADIPDYDFRRSDATSVAAPLEELVVPPMPAFGGPPAVLQPAPPTPRHVDAHRKAPPVPPTGTPAPW
jgi:hypothetical protein